MVNEERLHHMIKMAIFDTNQGKECKADDTVCKKRLCFAAYAWKLCVRNDWLCADPCDMGHLFHEPVNGESECNGYSGTADIRAGKSILCL